MPVTVTVTVNLKAFKFTQLHCQVLGGSESGSARNFLSSGYLPVTRNPSQGFRTLTLQQLDSSTSRLGGVTVHR